MRESMIAGRVAAPRWTTSRHAPLVTHGCLLAMTAAMLALLWWLPFALAVVPCALLHHRVGVLVHEYIHGIPFRRYRANHAVVTFYDGLSLSCGFLELFRATHLTHHRWLNSDRDPARQLMDPTRGPRSRVLRMLWALEAPQHVRFFFQSLSGRIPLVKPARMLVGLVLSLGWAALWIAVGAPEMVLYLVVLGLITTLVSSSLRGAIEHHGPPGVVGATNEYRAFLPLFHMNRHMDHHEHPGKPWYQLGFLTAQPLPASAFVTHWIAVYVTRRYVMLRPEARS